MKCSGSSEVIVILCKQLGDEPYKKTKVPKQYVLQSCLILVDTLAQLARAHNTFWVVGSSPACVSQEEFLPITI